MKKISFICAILFSLWFLSSCEKEVLTVNDKSSPQMRTFQNFTDLNKEIEKTTRFTFEELTNYENQINFNSFGKISDKLYYSLVNNDTNFSLEQAEMFVKQNPSLLVIENNGKDIFFETKYTNSPFRYVMNENRLFKVDTFLFKVFEGGHIVCGESHLHELEQISDDDFNALTTNEMFSVYKNTLKNRTDIPLDIDAIGGETDKERIRFQVEYGETYRTSINGQVQLYAYFNEIARGYRKATGIWWRVQRTLTEDYVINYLVNNNALISATVGNNLGSTTKQVFDYKIENVLPFSLTLPYGINNFDYYISHANGYVQIPAVRLNLNNL